MSDIRLDTSLFAHELPLQGFNIFAIRVKRSIAIEDGNLDTLMQKLAYKTLTAKSSCTTSALLISSTSSSLQQCQRTVFVCDKASLGLSNCNAIPKDLDEVLAILMIARRLLYVEVYAKETNRPAEEATPLSSKLAVSLSSSIALQSSGHTTHASSSSSSNKKKDLHRFLGFLIPSTGLAVLHIVVNVPATRAPRPYLDSKSKPPRVPTRRLGTPKSELVDHRGVFCHTPDSDVSDLTEVAPLSAENLNSSTITDNSFYEESDVNVSIGIAGLSRRESGSSSGSSMNSRSLSCSIPNKSVIPLPPNPKSDVGLIGQRRRLSGGSLSSYSSGAESESNTSDVDAETRRRGGRATAVGGQLDMRNQLGNNRNLLNRSGADKAVLPTGDSGSDVDGDRFGVVLGSSRRKSFCGTDDDSDVSVNSDVSSNSSLQRASKQGQGDLPLGLGQGSSYAYKFRRNYSNVAMKLSMQARSKTVNKARPGFDEVGSLLNPKASGISQPLGENYADSFLMSTTSNQNELGQEDSRSIFRDLKEDSTSDLNSVFIAQGLGLSQPMPSSTMASSVFPSGNILYVDGHELERDDEYSSASLEYSMTHASCHRTSGTLSLPASSSVEGSLKDVAGAMKESGPSLGLFGRVMLGLSHQASLAETKPPLAKPVVDANSSIAEVAIGNPGYLYALEIFDGDAKIPFSNSSSKININDVATRVQYKLDEKTKEVIDTELATLPAGVNGLLTKCLVSRLFSPCEARIKLFRQILNIVNKRAAIGKEDYVQKKSCNSLRLPAKFPLISKIIKVLSRITSKRFKVGESMTSTVAGTALLLATFCLEVAVADDAAFSALAPVAGDGAPQNVALTTSIGDGIGEYISSSLSRLSLCVTSLDTKDLEWLLRNSDARNDSSNEPMSLLRSPVDRITEILSGYVADNSTSYIRALLRDTVQPFFNIFSGRQSSFAPDSPSPLSANEKAVEVAVAAAIDTAAAIAAAIEADITTKDSNEVVKAGDSMERDTLTEESLESVGANTSNIDSAKSSCGIGGGSAKGSSNSLLGKKAKVESGNTASSSYVLPGLKKRRLIKIADHKSKVGGAEKGKALFKSHVSVHNFFPVALNEGCPAVQKVTLKRSLSDHNASTTSLSSSSSRDTSSSSPSSSNIDGVAASKVHRPNVRSDVRHIQGIKNDISGSHISGDSAASSSVLANFNALRESTLISGTAVRSPLSKKKFSFLKQPLIQQYENASRNGQADAISGVSFTSPARIPNQPFSGINTSNEATALGSLVGAVLMDTPIEKQGRSRSHSYDEDMW